MNHLKGILIVKVRKRAIKVNNKGIAGAKLPQMWVTGGNGADSKTANPLEMLIQTMTLEKLNTAVKPATTVK